MKRVMCVAAVWVGMAAVVSVTNGGEPGVAPAAAANKPGAPPLVLDGANPTTGISAPGAQKAGTFVVKNPSDQPLKIKAAASNCACLSVSAPVRDVGAGASVSIAYVFTAPETIGKARREAMVFCDGYQSPLTVSVETEVSYPIRAVVGTGSEITEWRGQVTLESLDKKPFRVFAVNGEPAVFEGFDASKDEPRASYTMLYDWWEKGTEKLPRFLVFQTNREGAELMDVKVNIPGLWSRWRPEGTWNPRSERVILGQVTPGNVVEFPQTLNMEWEFAKENLMVATAEKDLDLKLLSKNKSTTIRNGTDCTVQMTIPRDRKGLFHTVVSFKATSEYRELDVYGLIAP
ncbi:MAG TPA: DUF1573 domain-containing protein [Phycisphaerales bacterium]|nr:DUF1573 domain-containing protein [Phycisphaerales bacterium]